MKMFLFLLFVLQLKQCDYNVNAFLVNYTWNRYEFLFVLVFSPIKFTTYLLTGKYTTYLSHYNKFVLGILNMVVMVVVFLAIP